MELTQRLKNTLNCLIARKHTSRELMVKIPANNPPDYFKMLRHNFGITILKEKVKNKSHFVFWIPECEMQRVRKLLASTRTLASDKIGNLAKSTDSEHSISQSTIGGV